MNIIKNTFFKLLNTINYFILSFSILGIIYISFILYYLHNLIKCDCFQKINKTNYSDIHFLIFMEYIILILFILLFIISIHNIFLLKGGSSNHSKKYNLLSIFILFFILSINIYLLISIFKISQNINYDCNCSKSWIRYLLYFQGIILLFNTISLIIKLLLSK